MVTKIDKYLNFYETDLHLRAQRQEILSSNIANADTPNYKARDIDFNQILKQRLAQPSSVGLGQTELGLSRSDESHLSSSAQPDDLPVLYRAARQASADGNTVDMDIERTQFAENSLYYEVSVTMVNGQVKNMLAVLQG